MKCFFYNRRRTFKITLFIALFLTTLSFPQYSSGKELNRLNIKYGDDSKQRLDFYAPNMGSSKKYPVIIYAHGGGWKKGDKANVAAKPSFFTNNGYAFVSVNYRLFPNATYSEMAHDVAAAVKWVYEHAEQLQIDQTRINLMGHSAGGHLVMLIGTNRDYLKQANLPADTIRSIVNLDGPINLSDFLHRNERYKEVFGGSRTIWAEASPISYADGKNLPPMLLVSLSWPSITSFMEKSKNAGNTAELFEIHSLSHREITKLLGAENGPEEAVNMTIAVMDFLRAKNSR